jgi:hypothetical protein
MSNVKEMQIPYCLLNYYKRLSELDRESFKVQILINKCNKQTKEFISPTKVHIDLLTIIDSYKKLCIDLMTYCKEKVLFFNKKSNLIEKTSTNHKYNKSVVLNEIPLICKDDSHIITLSEFKNNLSSNIMTKYLDVSKYNKYLNVNKSKSKSKEKNIKQQETDKTDNTETNHKKTESLNFSDICYKPKKLVYTKPCLKKLKETDVTVNSINTNSINCLSSPDKISKTPATFNFITINQINSRNANKTEKEKTSELEFSDNNSFNTVVLKKDNKFEISKSYEKIPSKKIAMKKLINNLNKKLNKQIIESLNVKKLI